MVLRGDEAPAAARPDASDPAEPPIAAVSAQASDQGQLPWRLDAVQSHYGHTPNQLLVDAGYRNERDPQELEARGIDG